MLTVYVGLMGLVFLIILYVHMHDCICFVYPSFCVGHEHPFSILLLHISQQLHGGGESSVQNAPVQFLVRRKVTAGDAATGK